MTMDSTTQELQDQIVQIVADLFDSMLETPVEAVDSDCCCQPGNMLTAMIGFAGGWKGTMLFQCGTEAAGRFAQRLTGSDNEDDLTKADIADAVAELANIVGGNFKAFLPPETRISVPSVVEGKDYSVQICAAQLVSELAFTTRLGNFRVQLMEAGQ